MNPTVTKVPGIPKPPPDTSPAMRSYLEALAEAIEIRLGRRGDPVDRAITLRELIDSGLAKELRSNPFDPNLINDSNIGFQDPNELIKTDVPLRPTSFSVNGAYSIINMSWDFPLYENHNQTEIWSHTSDVLGDATRAGVSTGIVFSDPVGGGVTRYYWIRHVNTAGAVGPWNSSSGTIGQTATDVAHMLTVLSAAITSSELAASLATRIDLIDADASVMFSAAWRVAQEATARTAAILALVTDIPVYDSTEDYAVGQIVRAGNTDSKLYIAIQAVSASASIALSNTAYWKLYGDYDALKTSTDTSAAEIIEINTISATSTSAAALALHALTATVATEDAINAAAIVTEATTRANEDTAIAGTVTALTATVATEDAINAAAIVTEATTRANEDTAIAGTVTALTATVSSGDTTNAAAIVTEATTRANEDTAIAGTVTTLAGTVSSGDSTNAAAIVTEATTRATEDTAIAGTVTTLAGTVSSGDSTNAAAIVTEATTRANADTAISNTVTTVSSTVGSHTTSIATQAQSINGLSGQYSVKIDTNGHVAGFGLSSTTVSGTPSSAFIIRADKFAIIDPANTTTGLTNSPPTATIPFFVSGGTTYIKAAAILDASITAAKIGSVNADTITTGTLDVTNRINAGTINAGKINLGGSVLVDNNGVLTLGTTSITTAYIGTAAVGTLQVAGNAITATGYATKGFSTTNNLTLTMTAASNVTTGQPYIFVITAIVNNTFANNAVLGGSNSTYDLKITTYSNGQSAQSTTDWLYAWGTDTLSIRRTSAAAGHAVSCKVECFIHGGTTSVPSSRIQITGHTGLR